MAIAVRRSRPLSWPRATRAADAVRLSQLLVTVLGTAVMLEAMRVFVSYLLVVVDQSQRQTLLVITFSVFMSIGLAPLVAKLFGRHGTILVVGMCLGTLRLIMQGWELPEVRLVLGAGIVVLWGWLTAVLLHRDRVTVAAGVLAGLVLDLALRIAFLSLDLVWMPDLTANLITIALAAALIFAAVDLSFTGDSGTSAGWTVPLIAPGPGLALFHLVTGNPGLAQIKTGWDFPAASAALAAGAVIGLFAALVALPAAARPGGMVFPATVVGIVAAGAGGLWAFWDGGAFAPLGLILVVATSFVMVAAALLERQRPDRGPGVGRVALWFTLGMVLHVALLFAYYQSSGSPQWIAFAGAALALGALLNCVQFIGESRRPVSALVSLRLAAVPVAALLIACGWQVLNSEVPSADAPLGDELTVMTYNIQGGFTTENAFDLEAQAQTILSADPDVVVLQEVNRGWTIMSGADEALWLSRRLEMPFVFGGTGGDGLLGNVILSRAPLSESQRQVFSETMNVSRGFVAAKIGTENGGLWVIGTHLDNPDRADAVRLSQMEELLEFQRSRTPAIVLGDLNVDPDDPVITRAAEIGLADLGAVLGPDAQTTPDGRRIDYILTTSDLKVRAISILPSDASDHRAVVATLTWTE